MSDQSDPSDGFSQWPVVGIADPRWLNEAESVSRWPIAEKCVCVHVRTNCPTNNENDEENQTNPDCE